MAPDSATPSTLAGDPISTQASFSSSSADTDDDDEDGSTVRKTSDVQRATGFLDVEAEVSSDEAVSSDEEETADEDDEEDAEDEEEIGGEVKESDNSSGQTVASHQGGWF